MDVGPMPNVQRAVALAEAEAGAMVVPVVLAARVTVTAAHVFVEMRIATR